MQRITAPEDPRLDDYRHLTDSAARKAKVDGDPDGPRGVVIIEGLVALEQMFASEHSLRSILITPNRIPAVRDRFQLDDVEVFVATREVLESVTGFDVHRGVLASARRPPPLGLEQMLDAHPRSVLVQGVTDNENIGSIFRVTAAFGLGAVVLDDRCADPLSRRSIRVSSGWTLRVPCARAASIDAVIADLRSGGHRIVALTPAPDAIDLDVAADTGWLDDPVAFVVGAEGDGLDASTLRAADHRVRIPMHGAVDSLNVATSLAVVGAFSAARRSWR